MLSLPGTCSCLYLHANLSLTLPFFQRPTRTLPSTIAIRSNVSFDAIISTGIYQNPLTLFALIGWLLLLVPAFPALALAQRRLLPLP